MLVWHIFTNLLAYLPVSQLSIWHRKQQAIHNVHQDS